MVWGLLFIGMFSWFSGFGHMIGFFQDAAIAGGSFAILMGLLLEIYKIIVANKFKKVKLKIAQTSTVRFDSEANTVMGAKVFEGWLFLTDENLIFKSHKLKTQNNEMIIPMNSIQNIDKISFNRLSIRLFNGLYEFRVANINKWVELLN